MQTDRICDTASCIPALFVSCLPVLLVLLLLAFALPMSHMIVLTRAAEERDSYMDISIYGKGVRE